MATNSVNSFVNALKGGGARANQFEVSFTALGNQFIFLCRAAQIPALTIGEIAVPYRGRQVFLAGDRTYDAWTVTIMNDRSYGVRGQLESWMNNMQDIGAATTSPSLNANTYYATALVKQMDRNDATIRTYTLEGVWPTTLDAIDLAFDANDAIQEFGATFRFNWMTIAGGAGADSGGLNINFQVSGSLNG